MSERKATIRECDVCGREVSDDGAVMIGGSRFNGWFHVKETVGGTTLKQLNRANEWDVCGLACLEKLPTKLDV